MSIVFVESNKTDKIQSISGWYGSIQTVGNNEQLREITSFEAINW